MKILSITAQKPNSTGSGMYLTELIKSFDKLGIEQGVLFSCYEEDLKNIKKQFINIKKENIYPIIFDTEKLPTNIVGMSDVMPYKNETYKNLFLRDENLKMWMSTFRMKVHNALDSFMPDIIICHHLYLLTAIVVDICKNDGRYKNIKVYGISHNTDISQYNKNRKCRKFISENIKKLDKIFALSKKNRDDIVKTFGITKKIKILGVGYNENIFYNTHNNFRKNILYVGKVSYEKGVKCLVRAFSKCSFQNDVVLDIVGGAGDKGEYSDIIGKAKLSKNKIRFLGLKKQKELCKIYNSHDIFILPSFNEGMPLVVLEAIACGMKIVVTNLDGIKFFIKNNTKNAIVSYIDLPNFNNKKNIDSEMDDFEKNITKALENIQTIKNKKEPKVSISWDSVARKIINGPTKK